MDYSNPTHISKSFASPVSSFTFTFGVKQVCFIAVITLADGDPSTGIEAVSHQPSAISAQKVIRNGQLFIIRDGRTYSVAGTEMQ